VAIHESWPWKDRLLKDAALLEHWAAKAVVTERRSYLIEHKVLMAAYAMRKLHEAQKLSTKFSDRSVRCRAFPPSSERLTLSNNHKLDELYDFGNPEERTVGARDVLNLIVHSLAFGEMLREDMTVEGFLVTSDRRRGEFLLLVGMAEFVDLMREVGNDYPSTGIRVYDPEKDDYEVWQGDGEPPPEVVERLEAIRRKRVGLKPS
jgi:hypothetical protein